MRVPIDILSLVNGKDGSWSGRRRKGTKDFLPRVLER